MNKSKTLGQWATLLTREAWNYTNQKLNSHHPKMLCANAWYKLLTTWFWRRRYQIMSQVHFHYQVIRTPWRPFFKKMNPLFQTRRIWQAWFSGSEKEVSCQFISYILQSYLHLERGPLSWINLKSFCQRITCGKFGWNVNLFWRRNWKMWNSKQWTTCDQIKKNCQNFHLKWLLKKVRKSISRHIQKLSVLPYIVQMYKACQMGKKFRKSWNTSDLWLPVLSIFL